MRRVLMVVLFSCLALLSTVNGQKGGVSPQAGFAFFVTRTADGKADKIYVGANDSLICLDADSGHRVWLEKSPVGTVDVGPVVVGSTLIYMGDGSFSTAYGLDVETGHRKWIADQRSSFLVPGKGLVYLNTQTGNGVVALDPATGKVIWNYEAGGPGSIDRMTFYDGRVYTDLYILNGATGKVIRKFAASPRSLDVPRAFAAGSLKVFFANGNHSLIALDSKSGATLWTTPVPSQFFEPIGLSAQTHTLVGLFYDGHAFSAHQGVLLAFDATKGSLMWQKSILSSHEGLLPDALGTDERSVYILEPSGSEKGVRLSSLDLATGERRWSVEVPEGLIGPPVIVKDEIYVSNAQDAIYVLDLQEGKVIRKLTF